jgi:hypothetical protein
VRFFFRAASGAAFSSDGALGVQVSRPVGEIKVRIETDGGRGESLVKGVVVSLPAIALSVKPGGSNGRAQILGGLDRRTRASKLSSCTAASARSKSSGQLSLQAAASTRSDEQGRSHPNRPVRERLSRLRLIGVFARDRIKADFARTRLIDFAGASRPALSAAGYQRQFIPATPVHFRVWS